jgi:hypothetical protein
MNKVFHGILIVCILALLYLWIVPWKEKEVGHHGVLREENTTDVVVETSVKHPPEVSIEKIAFLFGWKKKPEKKNAPPEPLEKSPPVEEKVISATWLNPLGYVIGADGKKYFFFKDEKSNKVFQLTDDNVESGWKLLDVEDGEFLLENGGKKFSVTSQ